MIRLLIVDDHPAFRRGLELMLSDVADIEVVAQAASGEEAVELAAQATPDVVLMDLRMPGLDGIESTRRLKRLHSSLSVVVLTMFEDDASVFAAMRAGDLRPRDRRPRHPPLRPGGRPPAGDVPVPDPA